MQLLDKNERVLASVLALLVYALNEVRMFQTFPREAAPGQGRIHALVMRIGDVDGVVFLSSLDLALRWGLAGLTAGAALWALAETFQRKPAKR